jgi:hypothetical protein
MCIYQVLKQLAPKTSHVITLVPDEKQKSIYNGILRRHIERANLRKSNKKKKGDNEVDAAEVDIDAIVGSTKEANNVFSALRKAANHPLLLREHFNDPQKMELMANRLYASGYFGDTCTIEVWSTCCNLGICVACVVFLYSICDYVVAQHIYLFVISIVCYCHLDGAQ